jgi:sulfite reductase (NADPH) flavoprotein alpha-component
MNGSKAQIAQIVKRVRLTDEASEKQTFHLEIDLSQTDIDYQVGDCLAIFPHNHPTVVNTLLSHFPSAEVTPEHVRFLTQEANLTLAPKKLTECYGKADQLLDLLPLPISLDEFCASLAPLMPRFYSIASSMKAVGKAAHLTITIARNPPQATVPFGTCSDFLCLRAPLNEPVISLKHHPAPHFRLPEHAQDHPIVMIGPGTGIAPFRGFMQERTASKASCRNWIFFGEQTQAGHFYYKDDWNAYVNKGQLQIDTAFSRDGDQKVYVQHRMKEKASELWKWIHHDGAFIFICGDAKLMAKEVEATLLDIFQHEGGLDLSSARTYLKSLRQNHRYLRDVY